VRAKVEGEPVQLYRKEAVAYRYKTRWGTIKRQPSVSATHAGLIVMGAATFVLACLILLLPGFRAYVL
jgi:hypothetical protein